MGVTSSRTYTWATGDTITAARLLDYEGDTLGLYSTANEELLIINKSGAGTGVPFTIINDGSDNAIEVDTSEFVVTSDGSVETEGHLLTDDYLDVAEVAEPDTPASGYGRIYAKTDNKLYFKDDEGVESDILTGVSASIEPGSRAVDTVYQNSSGRTLLVIANLSNLESGSVQFTNECLGLSDSGTPPTTEVSRIINAGGSSNSADRDGMSASLIFYVEPSHYYEVEQTSGTWTLENWQEIELS